MSKSKKSNKLRDKLINDNKVEVTICDKKKYACKECNLLFDNDRSFNFHIDKFHIEIKTKPDPRDKISILMDLLKDMFKLSDFVKNDEADIQTILKDIMFKFAMEFKTHMEEIYFEEKKKDIIFLIEMRDLETRKTEEFNDLLKESIKSYVDFSLRVLDTICFIAKRFRVPTLHVDVENYIKSQDDNSTPNVPANFDYMEYIRNLPGMKECNINIKKE